MKTLFVAPDLFASEGGISRMLRLYLRALVDLAREGDQLATAALNDPATALDRTRALGGPKLREAFNGHRRKVVFSAHVLRRSLWADRVICGHVRQLAVPWLASRLRPSLRFALIAHGLEVWRPFVPWERAALRRAERILCVSEYTRRQMLRFEPGLDPARLVVVPNTFDPAFRPAYRLPPISVGASRPRILVVSRLLSTDAYKGVDTMIEAMPLIRREFPEAGLRIVGDGDDAPRLRELAATTGEGVSMLGFLDDAALQREYEACDLFALPSRKEGFGLVYLEAMGYGKPCLAARAGGAPEVVDDKVGALVEYGHVEQIASAISDLVRHPRAQSAILTRASSYNFTAFKTRLSDALAVRWS